VDALPDHESRLPRRRNRSSRRHYRRHPLDDAVGRRRLRPAVLPVDVVALAWPPTVRERALAGTQPGGPNHLDNDARRLGRRHLGRLDAGVRQQRGLAHERAERHAGHVDRPHLLRRLHHVHDGERRFLPGGRRLPDRCLADDRQRDAVRHDGRLLRPLGAGRRLGQAVVRQQRHGARGTQRDRGRDGVGRGGLRGDTPAVELPGRRTRHARHPAQGLPDTPLLPQRGGQTRLHDGCRHLRRGADRPQVRRHRGRPPEPRARRERAERHRELPRDAQRGVHRSGRRDARPAGPRPRPVCGRPDGVRRRVRGRGRRPRGTATATARARAQRRVALAPIEQ